MNNTNVKKANTDIPLSPEEAYLASQLFGKSLFSAIQLAKHQELRKRMQGPSVEGDADVLKIPIPANLMPGAKTAAYNANDSAPVSPGVLAKALEFNNNPIRMLLGGQSGFRDAKKEYYIKEKANIQNELMKAQKEYIDLLQQIKTGSEKETPCVDAFCNGIAHQALLPKEASEADDVQIEDGAVRRMLGDATSVLKKPFRPAIDTAAGGLLSTAGATAYLTYLLRKKMREEPESYLHESLPTRVELQPYK